MHSIFYYCNPKRGLRLNMTSPLPVERVVPVRRVFSMFTFVVCAPYFIDFAVNNNRIFVFNVTTCLFTAVVRTVVFGQVVVEW